MKTLIPLSVLLLLWTCRAPEGPAESEGLYKETFRPQFHFTPDHNWTNDPNGLVYFKGEYHLYYQYNPLGNRWGHMSWGHAVCKDLMHWTHLPVAINEYVDGFGDSVMIFSGSAVVDTNNTSGFFDKDSAGMVAVYTSHVHRAGTGLRQHQSIAYSKDQGRTYTRYEKNPVLDIGLKDFRDPKAFWHEPSKQWIMATVIPDKFKAHFYGSKNLKEWTFLSEFGPLGDTARIWECPDLFEIGYGAEKKWVLIISNSHPAGSKYVGMQYFVGQFDGKKFTADEPSQYPLYLDYGKDYYAAITYDNVPTQDGRRLLLGWANNWAYGEDIPTWPWKSAMAFPRELSLVDIDGKARLIQQPMSEYKTLRGAEISSPLANENRSVVVSFVVEPFPGTHAGLTVLKTDSSETIVGYDETRGEVYIDRTKSGLVSFHPGFPSIDRAPVRVIDGKISLLIFIDQSIVEVFVNGGEQVITSQVFPTGKGASIEMFSNNGAPMNVEAWEMDATW
jgi:fructan beta-fructosidase